MNENDKLYLELGAKDNISPILEKIKQESEELEEQFSNFKAITINDIVLKTDGALDTIRKQIQDSLSAQPFTIEVEASPNVDTSKITDAVRTILEAQEKLVHGVAVNVGATTTDTEGTNQINSQAAKENAEAVQQQAKSYEELKVQVDAVLGSIEKNTATITEERNAIRLINAEMKQLEQLQGKAGKSNETIQKRLEQLTLSREQHKQALQSSMRILQNDIKLGMAATGSMDELSKSLARMRTAYRAMSEEERNGSFGKNLLASIQNADKKIKELDASIGNHQRNVGNYGSAFNGLNMSVQQVVRELPSATMGLQMFFLAISNNLPILADQIKMAKEANNAMKAMGQETTPVWKQLIKSLFSWQTAMIVGITLLTIYGKEIAAWAEQLFTGQRAAISTTEATEKLNKALEKNDGRFSENAMSVKRLADEWKSLKTEAEKTEWIERNQSAFDQMGLSIRDVTAAEKAFVEYTPAVIEALKSRARAEAAKELAKEKYKEAFLKREKAKEEREKGVSTWDRIRGNLTTINTTGTGGVTIAKGTTANDVAASLQANRVQSLENEAETLEKEVNTFYDIAKLEDEKSKAELKRLGLLKEQGKTQKEQLQAQKANLQAQLDAMAETEAAGAAGDALRKQIEALDKRLAVYSLTKNNHKNQQNVTEKDLGSTKQVIDRELKELQEYISRNTENWNLYKSIFEKTGNRELAQSAFRNGRVWDDLSREFSDELSVRIEEAGKSIDLAELLNMTSAGAEEYLKDVDGAYALWQKINELTRGGYRKYLEDSASALGDILTYEEKVVAAEEKLKDLRSMKDENGNPLYGEGSPVIIKAMRELRKAEDEAFEHSADYVKFYNSILSMTISEAETIGQKIRENLDKSLQDGTKSAKQYQQAIKQIEEQLKKIRSRQTDLGAFMYGGADKLIKNQYEKAESDFNDSVDRMERARKDYDKAIRNDDKEGMKGAEARMEAAEASKNAAAAEMQAASAQMAAIDDASRLVHLINDSVQAINDSFNNIKAIFDSEGVDTESGSWGEWGTTLGVFSNISSKITAAFDAMKNGNPAGAISNLTGAVSNWFTGFNSAWDAKMERQIKIAQEHLNATKRLKDSIERKLGRTLGGIYKYQISDRSRAELTEAMNRMTKVDAKTFSNRAGKGALYAEVASQIMGSMSFPYAVTAGIIGSRSKKIAVPYYQEDTRNKMSKALESGSYYDEQMALLYKQRDELGWQLFNLYRKKKKDWPAIAEMLQQIEEVGDQIENAALDLANTIYGIDLHSWASELTEAIVSAWESGEDAVEAYGKKVEEIVKTLTTKILSQSVVESALKSIGIEELIENALSDDGVIDVGEAAEIGNILKTTSENVATSVQNILDAQEAAGAIERGNGSSSASGSIKNITENTADLLASYINAIRADVSVNRVTLDRILASVEKHGEMPVIAQAQLDQLRIIARSNNQIAENTQRNTQLVERIENILHHAQVGSMPLHIR